MGLGFRPRQAMRGRLILRSFNRMIVFIASGIAERPEFYVEKDRRTGEVPRDPDTTIHIAQTRGKLADSAYSVDYGGLVFEDDKPNTLAEALAALEKGLANWFKEHH